MHKTHTQHKHATTTITIRRNFVADMLASVLEYMRRAAPPAAGAAAGAAPAVDAAWGAAAAPPPAPPVQVVELPAPQPAGGVNLDTSTPGEGAMRRGGTTGSELAREAGRRVCGTAAGPLIPTPLPRSLSTLAQTVNVGSPVDVDTPVRQVNFGGVKGRRL